MKSLVCQAQHLQLNLLLYGQPMKLTKNWGDMFILPSIGYYPSCSVLCSLNVLKLALCNTIENGVSCIKTRTNKCNSSCIDCLHIQKMEPIITHRHFFFILSLVHCFVFHFIPLFCLLFVVCSQYLMF